MKNAHISTISHISSICPRLKDTKLKFLFAVILTGVNENTFAKAPLLNHEKLGVLLPVGEPCLDCSSIWAPLVLNERVFAPCCFSSSPARQIYKSLQGEEWRGHLHIEGAIWEVSKEN